MLIVLACSIAVAPVRTPAELGLSEVSRTGSGHAPLPNRWADPSDGVHPTNAWWVNLMLCAPPLDIVTSLSLEVSCNVYVIPYVVWPASTGLHFASPYRQEQGANLGQMFDDTTSVRLFLGGTAAPAAGTRAAHGWREDGYDDLTVRLTWPDAGVASTLARGSPYVSVEFQGGAVPLFATPQGARSLRATDLFGASIAEMACDGAECDGATLSGTKFTVVLSQSDETWLLFAYPALTLRCTNTLSAAPGAPGGDLRLESVGEWSGVIRAALLTNCTTGASRANCEAGMGGAPQHAGAEMGHLLDQYAEWYPVSGRAAYKVGGGSSTRGEGRSELGGSRYDEAVTISYEWRVHNIRLGGAVLDSQTHQTGLESRHALPGQADGAPLPPAGMPLVLMPHHIPLLSTPGATLTSVGYASVHGFARLAVLSSGLAWHFRLPEVPVSFSPRRQPAAEMRPALLSSLSAEAAWLPPENYRRGAGDPYNAGKLLSRMARTALIAVSRSERGYNPTPTAQSPKPNRPQPKARHPTPTAQSPTPYAHSPKPDTPRPQPKARHPHALHTCQLTRPLVPLHDAALTS